MLRPSIQQLTCGLRTSSATLTSIFSSLTLDCPIERLRNQTTRHLPRIIIRTATHKSEGRANQAKQGAGRRLGAKKSGGQHTKNIIVCFEVIVINILHRSICHTWKYNISTAWNSMASR